MNTLVAVICFAVMVAVTSGLGYAPYRNRHSYSSGNVWDDSLGGGIRNSWGQIGSLGGRFLDSWGSQGVLGRSHSRRYRRAAVGYGQYNQYRGSHSNRWGSGIRGGIRGSIRGGFGGIHSRFGY